MAEEEKWVSGKPVAAIIALLLIVAALVKWWPSDTRDVQHVLDAVADVLSVPPAEADVSRTARLADLRSYFADTVLIRFPEEHIPNRDAMMAIAEQYSPPAGGVFVEFQGVSISAPGDNTAHVRLTARISRKTGENDTTYEDRPASLDLAKRDGNWLITNVESPASPGAQ